MFKNLPVYNDGVCDIFTLDENDQKVSKFTGIRFQKRTVGYKRFYAAQSAQTDITIIIRIPFHVGINAHDCVEISGRGVFMVEQSQEIYEFIPPSIDLTLRQLEMHV